MRDNCRECTKWGSAAGAECAGCEGAAASAGSRPASSPGKTRGWPAAGTARICAEIAGLPPGTPAVATVAPTQKPGAAVPGVEEPNKPIAPTGLPPAPRTMDTQRAETVATGQPVSLSLPESNYCCVGPSRKAAGVTSSNAVPRASTPWSP